MLNLVLSLAFGVVTTLVLWLPGWLSGGEASVPGVLVAVGSYVWLARRTFKQMETLFIESASHLQRVPPNFELAIGGLERAYPFARWQFGVKSQIDTQIGVIYFLQQELNKALPYLERSLGFGHWLGGAMLGVVYYKKKDHEQMKKTFELVTRKAKKQGLVWSLYAYLLCQIGETAAAQARLAEGAKHNPGDEILKENLLALQNDKKMKMKGYKEQWYQFQLEKLPAQLAQPQMFGRGNRAAVRGRW